MAGFAAPFGTHLGVDTVAQAAQMGQTVLIMCRDRSLAGKLGRLAQSPFPERNGVIFYT
jgi:hypothetical protein